MDGCIDGRIQAGTGGGREGGRQGRRKEGYIDDLKFPCMYVEQDWYVCQYCLCKCNLPN